LPGLSGQPIFLFAENKLGRPHKAGDDGVQAPMVIGGFFEGLTCDPG
jgi:hypothetical protein